MADLTGKTGKRPTLARRTALDEQLTHSGDDQNFDPAPLGADSGSRVAVAG